jgi:DNA-binding transcriptional MerR regulator
MKKKTLEEKFADKQLDGFYSSLEVAELSGATLRQLQWWDERGVLPARRFGRGVRRYTKRQAIEIMIAAHLRRRTSLMHIRHTLHFVETEIPAQRMTSVLPLFLLCGDKFHHLAFSRDQAWALLTSALIPLFVIDISRFNTLIGALDSRKKEAQDKFSRRVPADE